MDYREHLRRVRALNDEYRCLTSIASLFELDRWSGLSAEGTAYRRETEAYVAQQKTALYAGEDARRAAAYFAGADLGSIEDVIERALIREFLRRYRIAARTPEDVERRYRMLLPEAARKWAEAREKRDFQVFAPSLEQVFALKRQLALAIEPDAPAFETLVGLTDEGADCRAIDRAFGELSDGVGRLLERIRRSPVRPDTEPLRAKQDPARMAAFARRLARESGFSESRGGFNDRVAHAFTSFLGPRDARVSTYRGGGLELVFTCLHEAGHAMYATGGSEEVNAANLWGGVEGGFHEAMARFNENFVGRSEGYWAHYYPELQEAFPDFRGLPREAFFRALNAVEPGVKRITADEVTYSLHVILRYGLERDCFSGALEVRDLARAWNERSERLLGVCPEDDAQGVLQDMHWAGDYIGYFQSYALGNLYGAALREAALAGLPDLDAHLARGNFAPLNAWLDEKVRRWGRCFTAGELIEKNSQKGLDAAPFLRYLWEKYGTLYNLEKEETKEGELRNE